MTGMKVQAKVESGLLISQTNLESSWGATAQTAYSTAVALAPTSTNNGSTWYHNTSKSSSVATGSGNVDTYKTLGASSGENVIVVATSDLAANEAVVNVTYEDLNGSGTYTADADKAYYLVNSFWLKSSGDEIAVGTAQLAKWLEVQEVSVTGTTSSPELDASLRIGVQIGNSAMVILAPYAAATASYNVNGSTETTANRGLVEAGNTPVASYNANVDLGQMTIPAVTGTALETKIFLWFEGEDANCKSDNVKATLDELTISVEIGLIEGATAPDGVATAA